MPPATLDTPPARRAPPSAAPRADRQDRTDFRDAASRREPAPDAGSADRFVLHTREGSVRLPGPPPDFDAVRAWKNSDDCPETGRYSYLGDRFEIDLTMESLNSHSTPKGELYAALRPWVKRGRRGFVACDAFTLLEPSVNLSCEPDLLLVLKESIRAGRVTLTPKANREGEWTEAVGAADLVCEIVSDSSTAKDVRLEPPLLFAAGVREFWRADCRGDRCEYAVFARGAEDWEPVPADADGFVRSAVLEAACRLTRLPAEDGLVEYDFEMKD